MHHKWQKELRQLLKDPSFVNWAKGRNKNDIQYWNAWIMDHPEQIEMIETAKSMVLGIQFNKELLPKEKINAELDSLLFKIGAKNTGVGPWYKTPGKKVEVRSHLVAAFILLCVGFMTFSFFQHRDMIVHRTNYGEIMDVRLPDGTLVALNGNSEIKYRKNNPRNIYFVGEAYFKVRHIPVTNAKFWVRTNDLKVAVLGTKFLVNTRHAKTKVVLDEGTVHLELNNGNIEKMCPGELISFSNGNKDLVHKKVTTAVPYSLWREGTYTFNGIKLEEVMSNLESTYGVRIAYENQGLRDIKLTGGIPNQNLTICIAAIEKALGLRISNTNNTLMIKATNIKKNYGELQVLKGVDLHIQKGEIVSIVGASGAGKTTLLQILGTLDTQSNKKDSELFINDIDITKLTDKTLAKFRNEHIGFIFQFHQLLPEFTALENVCIPAFIKKTPKAEAEKRAQQLLDFLGLQNRYHHKPNELSGGEQQRVAVARSLMNHPSVIFADEPSGNLDSESADNLHQLFFKLREEFGQTFVLVTHNEELANMADRKLVMVDGSITQ